MQTRGWKQLGGPLAATAVVVMVVAVMPATEALGAALSSSDSSSAVDADDALDPAEDGEELLSTTPVPSASESIDHVTGEVDGVIESVEETAGSLPGDEDGGQSEEENEQGPADDGGGGDEDPSGDDRQVDGDDEHAAIDGSSDSEPRAGGDDEPQDLPRIVRAVEMTRQLSVAATPSTVDLDVLQIGTLPFGGYIDIPAGPRSTREIFDMLSGSGASPDEIAEILAPFPIAGLAKYSFDWGAPRHSPTPHRHEGTDLFAPRGTPVVASINGVVTRVGKDTAIGGNSVRVTGPDGGYIYLAHLDSFAPAAVEGRVVEVGTVVGYVGDTGNALGTPPHLHFEMHPTGHEPVPPHPYLDQWLLQARERAEAFVTARSGSAPVAAGAASSPAKAAVQAVPFLPASETHASPVATVTMLSAVGAGIVAMRRRHQLAALLHRLVPGTRLGRRELRRRIPVLGALTPFVPEGSGDAGLGDRPAPHDVLEPFLRRQRELSNR